MVLISWYVVVTGLSRDKRELLERAERAEERLGSVEAERALLAVDLEAARRKCDEQRLIGAQREEALSEARREEDEKQRAREALTAERSSKREVEETLAACNAEVGGPTRASPTLCTRGASERASERARKQANARSYVLCLRVRVRMRVH
jgi:chromosome segregation ATPase